MIKQSARLAHKTETSLNDRRLPGGISEFQFICLHEISDHPTDNFHGDLDRYPNGPIFSETLSPSQVLELGSTHLNDRPL